MLKRKIKSNILRKAGIILQLVESYRAVQKSNFTISLITNRIKMDPYFISFDSFNKIMKLIISLDESAAGLLKMLYGVPVRNDYELFKKIQSEKVLQGVLDHSKKIKQKLIEAGLNQNAFPEKIKHFNSDFVNIQKDFKKLYQIIEDFSEDEYFVDEKGTLIKQTKVK